MILVLGLLVAATAVAQNASTIGVDEVFRGQRGYGLSVFAGDQPERFEVEVLGVLRNTMPDASYVLVRLSGQSLEDSGVVAGMSGSPVFLVPRDCSLPCEERLAGAVAFSWPFAREAIAGVTPIENMRRVTAGAPPAAASPAVALEDLLAERHPPGLLEASLSRLAQAPATGARSGVAWAAAGFGAETLSLLSSGLGALSPSGAVAQNGRAPTLENGSAVAAVLIDGDLKLASTGTITERRGKEVLAFGHSLLGLGEIRVPMAASEVLTVLSSQYSSFKLSNFGGIVGAFDRDLHAGVHGRLDLEAPTLPVRVMIEGGSEARRYQMSLAELPLITPALVAISVLGAEEAVGLGGGDIGLDLDARFQLRDHGELRVRQSFDGEGASQQAALHLLAYTGFLMQNGFEAVEIEALDIDLDKSPEPRTAVLVGGYAERTQVRPGQKVGIHVDLVPYRGTALRRDITLELPVDLPAGRYSLLVGDGVSIDGARLRIEAASPVRFDQALRLVRGFHSRKELVLLGLHAGQGLAVAGEVLPQLPGTVQSIWSAAASRSAVPLRLTVAQEHVEELEIPILGAVRIDLEVVRQAPIAGEIDGSGGAEGETAAAGAVAETAPAPRRTSQEDKE